jgi:hypothetical protein
MPSLSYQINICSQLGVGSCAEVMMAENETLMLPYKFCPKLHPFQA